MIRHMKVLALGAVMGVSTYVLRLVDCAGTMGAHKPPILTMMTGWYRSVATTASSATNTWTSNVQWLDQPPAPTSGQDAGSPMTINMIVFYVPDPSQSVIKLHPTWRGQPRKADDDTGQEGATVMSTTQAGQQAGHRTAKVAISEIYTGRCRGANDDATRLNLARLAFHETMHNQMLLLDNELHHGHGGGFAAKVVDGNSPNAVNTRDLGATWGRLVPQWPDGLQAWRTTSVDPLGWP